MPGEWPAGGPGPRTAVDRAPGELLGGSGGHWTPCAPSDSDEEYREEYKAIFSSKLRNRKVRPRKSLSSFLPYSFFLVFPFPSSHGENLRCDPSKDPPCPHQMSLSGVMDQSAAERQGFASLLQEKLRHLLMEDEVGGQLRCNGVQVTGRWAPRLAAPAH